LKKKGLDDFVIVSEVKSPFEKKDEEKEEG